MLTARGWGLLGGGALAWIGSRILGSSDLHIVAVGLVILPLVALLVARRWWYDLRATRRLGMRRAFPGTRVQVTIEIRNRREVPTPPLLVEDRLPPALGRRARVVAVRIPSEGPVRIPYEVTCGPRGRYEIGPLSVHVTDPFFLARHQIEFPDHHELIVYPEIEELGPVAPAGAGTTGESTIHRPFRSGAEFYAIRQYNIGDDLRRIHWPSTARMGRLMLRQDEAARGASVTIFLDTRMAAFGGAGPTFERAVSTAASVGTLYVRRGFDVRLSTPELPPRLVEHDEFLELLALVTPSRSPLMGSALRALRARSRTGAGLVVITRLPTPGEIEGLLGAGPGYTSRLALLVSAVDPQEISPGAAAEIEGRAAVARAALARGGWDVVALEPNRSLRDTWLQQRTTGGSWRAS